MELVKVLGVDPSMRNSGLAIVEYNTELPPGSSDAYKVKSCQYIKNDPKFKGVDAIINMLDLLQRAASDQVYQDVDSIIVESPPVMFNKMWSLGTISSISHIAGGCAVIFGLDKVHLFKPSEWNKGKRKEETHSQTIKFLGDPNDWNFRIPLKSKNGWEHILDAASMALWWIKSNIVED